MYERFTDRSRKIMQLASQEAQRFNHEYIGTEHVLLGLVKEGTGVAANVLKNLGVDLRKIRLEVERIIQAGPDMVANGKLPITPSMRKALDYAIEEAENLSHNYVGTEHLLLGVLREETGVACNVLKNLGLRPSVVREEVMNLIGAFKSNGDTVESLMAEVREWMKTGPLSESAIRSLLERAAHQPQRAFFDTISSDAILTSRIANATSGPIRSVRALDDPLEQIFRRLEALEKKVNGT